MTFHAQYRKYPYKERYPDPQDPRHSFYAFFRLGGVKMRKSLRTRNERIADVKFARLIQDLDKGVLGFSLRPKPIDFIEFANSYLTDGVHDLATASRLRHRQNLFGIAKGSDGSFVDGRGHLVEFFVRRDFKSIGPKDVLRYISHRRRENASSNTILKELATLSAMFQYGIAQEIVLSNPVLSVKKPRLRLVRPNYAPCRAELMKIFQHLYSGARRFFIAFCNSGCRQSELSNCNIRDVDFDHNILTIRGKGGKLRGIPMNEVLRQCITDELALRPNAVPTDPLFLNREGKRYKTIHNVLSNACKNAKCSSHFPPRAKARLCHPSVQ
jgi:integrase